MFVFKQYGVGDRQILKRAKVARNGDSALVIGWRPNRSLRRVENCVTKIVTLLSRYRPDDYVLPFRIRCNIIRCMRATLDIDNDIHAAAKELAKTSGTIAAVLMKLGVGMFLIRFYYRYVQ